MASDGPESKAVSQAPDQDGEGESSEQLTKFVSLDMSVYNQLAIRHRICFVSCIHYIYFR